MWKAILDNGETHTQGNDISSWRKLRSYCQDNKLKLKELYYNDILIKVNDAAFIIFESFATLDGYQSHKIGMGSIDYLKDRCRINWFGDKDYVEVIKGVPEFYRTSSIGLAK